ncbi:olfactory receptor 52E4-like [Gadus morhua]|jgi:olfactory receptor|uniref:olfactory receptor 52E4-like n=1 Tax=Gadus morhua TaxID=8049 RepID=UPI0011B73801|nr:olfactory receptor 52E4-like [Gadus morhua]
MNLNDTLGYWKMELKLESLNLETGNIYPAFIFGTLAYLITIFFNMLVLTTIVFTKSLHKPMFLLLLNLPIMDMIGATAFLPQLVTSIVSKNRAISYPGCFLQALSIHIYGTGNLMFLSAMAYDRYIAICLPLRYNAIMTSNILIRIISSIWLVTISLIGILLALFARFKICRNRVVDVYCNNPSLVKLVCEDSSVNNYYGLFTIILIQGGSLLIIVYTYIQILLTCAITKQSDARGKALQTCGTHLIVFIFLEVNTAISLISHRFESVSPYLRRALGVSIVVFPPLLNPIVYGFKTKELRRNIIRLFRRS